MAKIPETTNLTLQAIDSALEEKQKLEAERNYLGMSQIGEECWRKLFYSFRNACKRQISASGIRAIEDGYLQEKVMIDRLKLLPYIELHTTDPEQFDNQIGFRLLDNQFCGHCDGIIKGILEAPKSWHIWECKAVNETKFKKLISLKDEFGEKKALMEWDIIYFAQAQIYMYCAELERHYLTVVSPGGRNYISCRTELDKNIALSLIEKAKTIIDDNWTIPAKLSEQREFYKCKWCEFSGICHDGDIPALNCKTCRYSETVADGKRYCNFKKEELKNEVLPIGCKDHIYNPALIPAKLLDHQADGCIYQTQTGFKFANILLSGLPELKGEIDAILTSQELYEKIKNINNFVKTAIKVQKSFDGEFQSPKEKAWDKKVDSRLI